MKEITLRANGLTFRALEEGQGPIVLCLHGFPDHNRSWRLQLPALAAAGFRAIAPMNRGYEPGNQPADGDYAIVRMAEDAVGWLDDLDADRVHLVGHDWGAVIGYAVAAMAPERLASLTTLAVPHLRHMHRGVGQYPVQVKNSWYMLFFQLRLLADQAVKANDFAFLEKLWRDWSPGWQWPEEEMAALKRTFAQEGVLTGALAYYRAFFQPWTKSGRETMTLLRSKLRVPTMALTGETDGCMDTRLWDVVLRPEDFPGGLRVERVSGAGHFLHQEKPDEVNRLLLEWITRGSYRRDRTRG
jgi:pimeloyl-ACP methyl ester carboxylesterase